MLIEESKIVTSPSRFPDPEILKPVLRAVYKRKSTGSPPQRWKSRPLSRGTPKDFTETLPRATAGNYYTRTENLSDRSNHRRKGRKSKLAEVYQDRGYSKLFSELIA